VWCINDLEMEIKTRSEARKHADALVEKWMKGAAVTGWIPGSVFFLGAADAFMIRQVAETFGVQGFDESAVKAHIGGVVGSAVGGAVAAEAAGLVPGIGWIAKSATMAVKAKLIGNAVIDYFEQHSPLPA
jgi:hypothetical protein